MSATILVVDDQYGIRLVLKEVLGQEGYDIIEARTGVEALEKIRSQKFDLMILDYKLPGIDGLTVVKELERTNPNLPVILITGYEDEELFERAKQLQINQVITKPFNIDEISSAANRILK